ncbi:unnamed protein product [Ixodes pacificus]
MQVRFRQSQNCRVSQKDSACTEVVFSLNTTLPRPFSICSWWLFQEVRGSVCMPVQRRHLRRRTSLVPPTPQTAVAAAIMIRGVERASPCSPIGHSSFLMISMQPVRPGISSFGNTNPDYQICHFHLYSLKTNYKRLKCFHLLLCATFGFRRAHYF